MAKQFTAIMTQEAIIGPTINSQVDGLESNIRATLEERVIGELERKGGEVLPSSQGFPFSFLYNFFHFPVTNHSHLFLDFFFPALPALICMFHLL